MTLNTAEKFLILIQHPEKKRFMVSGQVKSAGLIGSILLDLTYNKNIKIEAKTLSLVSAKSDLSPSHQIILEQIDKSAKTRKIKAWVTRFVRKAGKYQKGIVAELENKGCIKIHPKRFLGIKYYRTQLINKSIREQIINEVREIIFGYKKIDTGSSLILGLIEACKIYKIFCRDRKELKICKRKVREIMKSDLISQGVDAVIREMNEAIVAVSASVAVSSVVTGS